MQRLTILYIFLCFATAVARPDDHPTPTPGTPTRIAATTDWQEQLASYLDDDTDEATYAQVVERLSDLAQHPIDLNRATADDLAVLPFLSGRQIGHLLEYRRRCGALQSVYELTLIYGFDLETLALVQPFVAVAAAEPAAATRPHSGQSELIVQGYRCLNTREGYRNQTAERQAQNKAYLGDAWHETIRYRYRRGERLTVGFVLDKDAGEAYRDRFPWADALHYYIEVQSRGACRKIIVGDYRIRLGSGLILNQNFSLGKNVLASTFMTQDTRMATHSSTDEYNFGQGVATDWRIGKHLQLMPFASVRQIDGILTHDTLTGIKTDGLHHLDREVAKRDKAWLSFVGLHAGYRGGWYSIGLNALYTHLDKTYDRPMRLYNRHYFRGHELMALSADYRAHRWGFDLKGETALSGNDAIATIHALRRDVTDRGEVLAIYRYYAPDYRQLHGSSFGESSDLQAESGLYVQGTFHPLQYWSVTAAADFYHLTAPKYGIDAPSRGYEWTLRTLYERNRWAATLRYRIKKKKKNDPATDAPGALIAYYRHSTDATCSYRLTPGLMLKGYLQCRAYSAPRVGTSWGYCLSQALSWKQDDSPLALHLQGTWFKTDSYDSRIYLSERNLLYSFNIPMLYGTGVRYTATCTLKLTRRFALDAQYALTNYSNVSQIGTGLQAIRGNNKHDLRLQCRCKF